MRKPITLRVSPDSQYHFQVEGFDEFLGGDNLNRICQEGLCQFFNEECLQDTDELNRISIIVSSKNPKQRGWKKFLVGDKASFRVRFYQGKVFGLNFYRANGLRIMLSSLGFDPTKMLYFKVESVG